MNKFELKILPYAQEDIYEIVSYFYSINPDFSKKLYFNLKDKINEIEYFPERGQIVPELEKQGFLKYRQLIEGNYRIIYSIVGQKVFVHLVIDSRRNLEEILIKKLQS